MKQIKFNTCLKALLEKTKVTTIRKAYFKQDEVVNFCPSCACLDRFRRIYKRSPNSSEILSMETYKFHNHDKPCKYKVGEIVKLVWTGEITEEALKELATYLLADWGCKLGKAKIKSIEKIELDGRFSIKSFNSKSYSSSLIVIREDGYTCTIGSDSDMIQDEGFESIEQMCSYLSSYAPEIKERPMPFWLIEWEYI